MFFQTFKNKGNWYTWYTSAILPKGDNLCDFLFAVCKPCSFEKGPTLKGNNLLRRKYYTFWVHLDWQGRQIHAWESFFLSSISIFLKMYAFYLIILQEKHISHACFDTFVEVSSECTLFWLDVLKLLTTCRYCICKQSGPFSITFLVSQGVSKQIYCLTKNYYSKADYCPCKPVAINLIPSLLAMQKGL